MLTLLWSILLLASVKGQGGPPPPPEEQEVVLMITSSIYVCEDDVSKGYMDTGNLSTIWYNESTTVVDGNLEMKKDLDPGTKVELKLLKLANGKKETMFSMEIGMCDELLLQEESDFHTLFQYMDFPSDCKITKGSYGIKNLVADLDDLPINSGNMGDYQVILTFFVCEDAGCSEKTFEGCVMLDCVIEPL